ncbi:MAG: hypothetical protein K2Y39_25345 [Candidatus Obscuribacterales bacterium]|nr:hypothetical protein [Candidatus Obscuribacterales bacterium]
MNQFAGFRSIIEAIFGISNVRAILGVLLVLLISGLFVQQVAFLSGGASDFGLIAVLSMTVFYTAISDVKRREKLAARLKLSESGWDALMAVAGSQIVGGFIYSLVFRLILDFTPPAAITLTALSLLIGDTFALWPRLRTRR